MRLQLPNRLSFRQTSILILILTTTLTLLGFVGLSIYQYQHPAITIVYTSQSPQNTADISLEYGVSFHETVLQPQGYSKLAWGNNQILIVAKAEVVFTPDSIKVTSGNIHLQAPGTIYLVLGEDQFTLINAEIILSLDTQQLIVLSGRVTTPNATAVERNHTINLSYNYSVSPLDRSILNSEPSITYLIVVMSEHQDLTPSLLDITPPVISDITPNPNTISTADKVFISGKTEIGAQVDINASPAAVNESGEFALELPLSLGENTFTISSTDAAGNTDTQELTIIRQQPVTSVQSPTACSREGVADQIITAINTHRAANGLGQLSPVAGLNNAAQSHSCWMQSVNSLNHVGNGGSSFSARCTAAGAVCDAENIAWVPGGSAQSIVDLWKASSGHNQNMLGSHTQIGVGYAGGYATAVFY